MSIDKTVEKIKALPDDFAGNKFVLEHLVDMDDRGSSQEWVRTPFTPDDLKELVTALEDAQADNKVMKEALEEYADPLNWRLEDGSPNLHIVRVFGLWEPHRNGYDIASSALSRIGNK